MKYILITKIRNEEETKEFDTAEAAIKEGNYNWNHFCKEDRKALKYMYVLESVNPDEDAEDHFDGDPVKSWGNAYIIRDREAGNFIDEFKTLEDAEKALTEYEETDRREGNYTPDFYEIVESQGEDM